MTDKFEKAADHLAQVARQIDPDSPNPNTVMIALAEAKRVRRESTLLTRAIAQLRDSYSQEAQANDPRSNRK